MRRSLLAAGFGCAALAGALLTPTTAAAAPAGPASASQQPALRLPATPAPKHPKTAAAARPSPGGGVPAGDEIVTATSDTAGYHLFAASAGDGWHWHALATLQPGGFDEEAWIGEHCTTGDGRYVVAVVAPWSANNSAAGIAAGGIAYAVDAHTGAVRPLASGLMLSYFDPGCGTGSTVALSRYTDAEQTATQILTVDAATGATRTSPVIQDQVTSAVPVGRTVYAAEGHRLVSIDTAGTVTGIASHAGAVFDLTPNPVGGVDYLAGAGKDPQAQAGVFRVSSGGHEVQVASGTLAALRLLPGTAGATSVSGAAPGAAITARPSGAAVRADSFADLSTSGTTAVLPGAKPGTVRLADLAGTPRGGGVLPTATAPYKALPTWPAAGAKGKSAAAKSAMATGTASTGTASTGKASTGAAGRNGTATTSATSTSTTSTSTTGVRTAAARTGVVAEAAVPGPPGGDDSGATCAVPRNDPTLQVPQPTDQQIDWALNLAGQYGLPGRSDSWANLHTGAYDPSADFPLPAPFDSAELPQQIMQGIFAQESNWKQASPHAAEGLSGNPLIADYYGIYNNQANPSGYVDYAAADCGYGLGQITDLMRLSAVGDAPSAVQKRVAVDYTENAAATAYELATKWVQLSRAGVTVGNNDPMELEDWYFVIWAYNSGVNPQASTGNSTGCTPGPSCADSAGNWGLGWTNNPANPTYDPLRHPFLHYQDLTTLDQIPTYQDAASPQDWPYQEKVYGWMESGQYEGDGYTQKFTPMYDYAAQSGSLIYLPGVYDFCDGSDDCDPLSLTNPCGHDGDTDPLQWHCWWHQHVGDPCPLLGGCNRGGWSYTVNDAEPAATNPFPSICSPPGDFSDTYIVDDEVAETNLAGCAHTPAANAAMTWSPNEDPNGEPFGDIDLHQLGSGYGGRTLFTHLEDPDNALWGGTMTWQPGNLQYDVYDIEVFIPSIAAAGDLTYTVHAGAPLAASALSIDNIVQPNLPASVTVNQNDYGNEWVSLGTYYLSPGSNVTATNVVAGGDGTTDVAFDAVAFRPVSSYVSLGDSYSSGEGTGNYDQGTDISNTNQCHRSANSYARVWASAHDTDGIPVVQLACSGAVTTNLTTSGQWNEPAQIPATPRHAARVMLTVGGNDVGFAGVLTHCLNPLNSCEDYYNQDDDNNEDNVIDAVEPTLESVYGQIGQQAPLAAVTALTYPSLFEPVSTCPSIANLPTSDVGYLINEAAYLDDAIVQAATDSGIQYLDERDAFVGHELCTGSTNAWVYSLPIPWPSGTQVLDSSAWFHPTPAGQGQLAADLGNAALIGGEARSRARPQVAGAPGWMPRHVPPGLPLSASVSLNELARIHTLGRVVAAFPAPTTAYDRNDTDQFPSTWQSIKKCDVRQRVLERDALTAAQQPTGFTPFAMTAAVPGTGGANCQVTAGTWDWPYDLDAATPNDPVFRGYTSVAALIDSTNGLQIDHIVPLAEGWNSGLWNQTLNDRKRFYNDRALPQLWAVSSSSNNNKSDQDPYEWMPQNPDVACAYDEAWVEVKYHYGLLMSTTEFNTLTTLLNTCP